MTLVLDSWAVLRWLEGSEPAAARVDAAVAGGAVLSWINLGEVFYVVRRASGAGIAHDAPLLTGDPELLQRDGPWHAEDLRAYA